MKAEKIQPRMDTDGHGSRWSRILDDVGNSRGGPDSVGEFFDGCIWPLLRFVIIVAAIAALVELRMCAQASALHPCESVSIRG